MTIDNITLQKIKEINLIINNNLKAIGFLNNQYINSRSKVIVECQIHGKGTDFCTPWIPPYNSLKEGKGCPKCAGTYSSNTEESLKDINSFINPKLKALGFINREYTGIVSKLIIECSVHGKGTDFCNPWTPTLHNLKQGKGCPKCSKLYSPTSEEAINEGNKCIDTNLKIIGFVDGKYAGARTRCIVECKIHGLGNSFETPWNPHYYLLKEGKGCPKCNGNYVKTKDELIKDINNHIHSNLKLINFIGDKYNTSTQCIVECKIHGRCDEFKEPWIPLVKSLKNGSSCPKCKNTYSESKKETIFDFNHETLKIIDFLDDKKNNRSKLIVECKIHGKGTDFLNPWTPSYQYLKEGYGCPKCSGNYSPTTEEAISNLNKIIEPDLKIIGFVDNKYQDSESRTIVECKIHGLGCNFEKPWNPKYNKLKLGGSCPICAVEKADLQTCLKNVHQFDSKRNLYFITFKNLKNDEIFYKIGVSTENGCLRRFKQLKKDNLEIIKADEIITKNIFALLTEYYVLTHFQQYKKNMFHVLKHNCGGSECFNYDLTKIFSLKDMISNAIENFDSLINNFNLTEDELFNIKNEFLILTTNNEIKKKYI